MSVATPTRARDARRIAKELQLELSSESRTLYFHGESMRPFLIEGDEVVVEPVKFEDLRIGDVVTYRVAEKFPTRRIVRKRGRDVRFFCENWPQRRFFGSREDILGRAVARRRGDQWITSSDREWRAARRRALVIYVRVVGVPWTIDLVRRAVRKALRVMRIVRPTAVQDHEPR